MKSAIAAALIAGASAQLVTVSYTGLFFAGSIEDDQSVNVVNWVNFPNSVLDFPGAYTTVALTSSFSFSGLSCLTQTQVDQLAFAFSNQNSIDITCSGEQWAMHFCDSTVSDYEVVVNGDDCVCDAGTTATGGRLYPHAQSGNWGYVLEADACPGITQALTLTFTAPQVILDPVFTGFDGSEFEFKGVAYEVFNLISDVDFQLNARMVPWTHGTFMGDLGMLFGDHTVEMHANATVLIDGVDAKTNVEYTFETATVLFDGRKLTVQHTAFDITAVAAASNRVEFSAAAKAVRAPHGVMGQTYGRKATEQTAKAVGALGEGILEGSYIDYLVEDGLTGTMFSFNRFGNEKFAARRAIVAADATVATGRFM